MSEESVKKRIDLIDALRGLSVVLMVIHHMLFDFVEFLGAPEWLYTNPVFDVLHYIFAGVFILLSGVSSQFSRSNVKRGLKVIAVAVAITLVTWFIGTPIWFGILHLLGFSMLFFGLTRKLWDSLPRALVPVLYAAIFIAGALATAYIPIESEYIWMLGWTAPGFISYDYFPILPWLFLFLFGTWAGHYVVEEKLPRWFYDTRVPVFPAIGRKSLIIYILHQPVLYGIVMLILRIST